MAKDTQSVETKPKDTYKGVCNFCHQEIDKAKMTQHLKSCKERKASIAAEAAAAQQSRKPRSTKLYHIFVEGTDLPMYYMHIELPALFTLYDLDDFLRATWVECCSHLSEFRIGKTSYLSQTEEDFMDFEIFSGDEEAPGDDEEDEDDDFEELEDAEEDDEEYYGEDEALRGLRETNTPAMEELANMSPQELLESMNTLLTNDFQTDVASIPPEEFKERFLQLFENRLRAEAAAEGEEFEMPAELRDQLEQLAGALQTMFQFPMLANMMPSEHDMGYELRDVLKVGDKFSYTYDFGSSTELRMRVAAEREGYFRKDDEIRVLARNLAPVIPCRECGKPATRIEPGYIYAEYGAVCDSCARKIEDFDYEELLPVVNSPRTGVCAYTG